MNEEVPEMHPVETSNQPIHKIDAVILMKLDEILSAQIPVTVELRDGTKMPFDEYDEETLRDSKLSLLAEDDGDHERPKTRSALMQMAAAGTIHANQIDAMMEEIESMGGLTDASVLTNVCKSDWGPPC
ncbi:MAG TPA: hypothetical protein VF681_06135 [Abditibacteriaceae bacterium]|jgi:hypothetical protein